MIRIAIVEDDNKQVSLLNEYIERYKQETGENFLISAFSNGLNFLEAYDCNFDIVLMDIEMKIMNGMEAAIKLRKKDENVCLIFITNMAQYAIKGYEVDAMDFIVKPVGYFVFKIKLEKAIGRIKKADGELIRIRHEGSFKVFDVKDIYYVESRNHIVTYHTASGEYTERKNISTLGERLEKFNFIMINRCYLVNIKYITEVKTSSLIVNKDELSVSRSRKNAVKKALADYLGGWV